MKRHTHLGVYGVLVRNNQVLLVRKGRGPHTGKWDFPGGTIEFGETPYETLLREFEEETGLTRLQGTIRASFSYTLIHSFQKNELEELHHIGILYDVELTSDGDELKTYGDGQDSLGAEWINVQKLKQLPVTPFVSQVFKLEP